MTSHDFEISQLELDDLLNTHPNIGKNSDVGKIAVKIVQAYFKQKNNLTTFTLGSKGADLEVNSNGRIDRYEIKGTTDSGIAWTKLKVSSKDCYDCLVSGMTLIRVTSIGRLKMKLHFLKFGEDFTLVPEVRYSVKPLKGRNAN